MAAVLVALWAFLAFSGGDDDGDIPIEDAEGDTTTTAEDEDRTSTTRRRSTTTTTTHVVPGAPLLGEPTGLALAIVGSSGRVIDLDTGAVTRVGVPIRGVIAGGLLVDDEYGVAAWPPPFDGSGSTTILPPGPAGVVEQLWVVGDGRLVWVMERPEDERLFGSAWSMSLVDLDGAVLGRFELPTEVWPAGATDHGVVVTAPGGVYLMGADGEAERVSTGDVSSVAGDRIHVANCDVDLRCHTEVFDGRGRLVDERPAPRSNAFWGTAAPDGRLAQITFSGEMEDSSAVTIDGVTVFEQDSLVLLGGGGPNGLAWSPDGRWLAIATQDGIHVLDTLGDGGPRVIDPGLVEDAVSLYFIG